jgi:hypothetical protein
MAREMLGMCFAGAFVLAAFFATSAQAAVTISARPTSNVTCSGGVCSPTATRAVLSASDLETMLASGDVIVTTTGSGVQARDIDVKAPVGWSSTHTLTLNAYGSMTVYGPVTIEGLSALSLTTNGGGGGGKLSFGKKANITFADLSSQLLIDGSAYVLVGDIKTLAADIGANPGGRYALSNSYNAAGDGTYENGSPINYILTGTFEGLGNTISNLTISVGFVGPSLGLFSGIGSAGGIYDLHLVREKLTQKGADNEPYVGGLVGENLGSIFGVSVNGVVAGFARGGDVGDFIGGMVGYNMGTISDSYSTAKVRADGMDTFAGGLAGVSSGTIVNSYATGAVTVHGQYSGNGGLIGYNLTDGEIISSYATGLVKGDNFAGGFAGISFAGLSDSYWDTTTSGTDIGVAQGVENGVTGLTTAQFQSGLPAEFDPAVWAENPKINNGFPYLIANPPPR